MKTKRQKREAQPTPKDAAADLGTPLQKTGVPPQNETLVALHRARFVDWSPSAATASAVSGDGTLLAVARESGDVELWQTDHWTCITVSVLSCIRLLQAGPGDGLELTWTCALDVC